MKNIISISNLDLKTDKSDFFLKYLIRIGIPFQHARSLLYGPFEEDFDDWRTLSNIQSALNTLHTLIVDEHKTNFFLMVDSDVDGYTSASIFYLYFKERYPHLNITWRLHPGKEHGVVIDYVPENTEVVIIPDAGSMQLKEQQELVNQGKYVFIIDHHEITERQSLPHLFIVNNTVDNFRNKYLSGAGVVLQFIRGYDDLFFDDVIYRHYMDLAAVGIIADMMDTSMPGCNYIIQYGLSHIYNQMLQAVLMHLGEYSIGDLSHPTKKEVAWNIAPMINGLIRAGAQEEKETFFRALISVNSHEIIETTYRQQKRCEDLYSYAARIAANAKSRQDAAKKRGYTFLIDKIERENLNQHKILAVVLKGDELKKVDQNFTGVIAMELLKAYGKPVLLLRQCDAGLSGSSRSKKWTTLPSFLQVVLDSGLAIMAQGHDNAFGATFTEENLSKFVGYCDNTINLKDAGIVVYHTFDDTSLDKAAPILHEFAKYSGLYGQGIEEAQFAFTFPMSTKNVTFCGANKDTLKFSYKGVEFLRFKSPDIKEIITNNDYVDCCIIGVPEINTFNMSVQIRITDYEFTPREPIVGRRSLLDLF